MLQWNNSNNNPEVISEYSVLYRKVLTGVDPEQDYCYFQAFKCVFCTEYGSYICIIIINPTWKCNFIFLNNQSVNLSRALDIQNGAAEDKIMICLFHRIQWLEASRELKDEIFKTTSNERKSTIYSFLDLFAWCLPASPHLSNPKKSSKEVIAVPILINCLENTKIL